MSGRDSVAAFPGDLAFGAGSHCFASIGNNSLRRAMDRTIACPLQYRRTRGSRRSAPPQWRNGNDPETRASGEAAWPGGIEGDRLVDPDTTSKEPQIGFARRGGSVQKKLADALAEEAVKHPGKAIEVFATDEHRIGLKPVTRCG